MEEGRETGKEEIEVELFIHINYFQILMSLTLETIPVRVRVPIGVAVHLAGELHGW